MWETANTSFSPRGNLSRWGACALWQQGCVPWVGWEDGGRVDTTELREAGLEQKHKQTQPAQFWSCGIKILDSLMALCWQEFQGFAAGLLATGMHLIGVFFYKQCLISHLAANRMLHRFQVFCSLCSKLYSKNKKIQGVEWSFVVTIVHSSIWAKHVWNLADIIVRQT